MEDYFRIGVIASTHGVRGEVKVYPTTEDPGRFKKLKSVFLLHEDRYREISVSSVRFFKNMVILKLDGINDMDQARLYLKDELYVDRAHAIPLEEGEYYVADLLGLSVVEEDGTELGTLKEVLPTGANDVYVVSKEGRKDLLIPVIKECVLDISPEEGRITVHLLPGLSEL